MGKGILNVSSVMSWRALITFFSNVAARYVWGIVGNVLGVGSRPISFNQYFWWIQQYLPVGRNIQVVGLAAICWAIWKLRNKACFQNKLIRCPAEIICYACVFLKFWAGLLKEEAQGMMIIGAEAIQVKALKYHVPNQGGEQAGDPRTSTNLLLMIGDGVATEEETEQVATRD